MTTSPTTPATEVVSTDVPVCRICGTRAHWLGKHLADAHTMGVETYLLLHPGAPTVSEEALRLLGEDARGLRRALPPDPDTLRVEIMGHQVPVNPWVPSSVCLPPPANYRWPQHGDLARNVDDALTSIFGGGNVLIHGMPGTGKDAVVHALSAFTRRPTLMKQVRPGADINGWFFSRSFNRDGTDWELGHLLRVITEGYLITHGPHAGMRVPYMVLLTDIDRATKAQAENFRLILDSIEGRVEGPGGMVYDVLPGTQFVCTANTSGGGDSRGRMVSANVMDGSLMDRFDAGVKFTAMEWADEEPIVQAKFPLIAQVAPDMFRQVGTATKKLREAIDKESLYAEFSHRAVCRWFRMAENIIRFSGEVPRDLVQRSARSWMGLLPDDETRISAQALIENDIRGGIIGAGIPRDDVVRDPLANFGKPQPGGLP